MRDLPELPNGWVDGEDNLSGSLIEAYHKWYDSRPPELAAQMQAEWSAFVAHMNSPEGQAEAAEARARWEPYLQAWRENRRRAVSNTDDSGKSN